MLRIIRGRGYGKTYDLIKYALKHDVAILTCTEAHAQYIREMSRSYFGKEVRVYSVAEWQKDGYHHNKNDKYVVDEIELVTGSLLDGQMVGYSMSME